MSFAAAEEPLALLFRSILWDIGDKPRYNRRMHTRRAEQATKTATAMVGVVLGRGMMYGLPVRQESLVGLGSKVR